MADVTVRGPFDLDQPADVMMLQLLESVGQFESTMRRVMAVFNKTAPALGNLQRLLTMAPPVEMQRWEDDGGAVP